MTDRAVLIYPVLHQSHVSQSAAVAAAGVDGHNNSDFLDLSGGVACEGFINHRCQQVSRYAIMEETHISGRSVRIGVREMLWRVYSQFFNKFR